MKKVKILVLGDDLEAVTSGLGRLGVMHLSRADADVEGLKLTGLKTERAVSRWQSLSGRIEHIARLLNVDAVGREKPASGFHDPEHIEREVFKLEDELNESLRQQQELTEQVGELHELISQVESFAGVELPLDRLDSFSFLHFAIGALPERRMKSLKAELGSRALLVPLGSGGEPRKILAISSKKGRWALQTALANHGFKSETFGDKSVAMPDELLKTAHQQLDEADRKLRDLQMELDARGRRSADLLQGWHYRVRIAGKMAEAQGHFAVTAATSLIVGWVPVEAVTKLHDEVLKLTGGRAVIEVLDPDKHPEEFKSIPTMFQHSRLLKPFELLVSGFGTPGYNEVEPTILVAVTFLFMFGAMFGDIGHGLALALIGLLVNRLADKSNAATRDFGLLILMAGVAGIVGGLVYGSFFGHDVVAGFSVPRLWADPLEHAESLLVAMVGFGVAMVSMGLILNVVNRLRNRDVAGSFLDKFGLVGIFFYWGAIGLVLRYVMLGEGAWWQALLILGLPLALMVLAEPLLKLFGSRRGDRTEGPSPTFLMQIFEGLIGTLEACMSYLTNTISFVRIGAFALAHAGFCLAVFEADKAVCELPGGPVWSVLVLILGNALIIALEGLIVSIQAMRLEYYEFFSKFFRGGGKVYEPFGIE